MTIHHDRAPRLALPFRRLAIPAVLLACLLAGRPAGAGDLIDINSATAQEFAAAMTGVGLKKGMAIVAYREEHGPFATIEDLAKVRGIGGVTVDTNRHRLSVNAPDAEPSEPKSE